MKPIDTIVVGGGVFGCVITKTLLAAGQNVLLIDDARPMGGSRPSGGLMKPSWMSFLDKQGIQTNLELLNRLYGVEDVQLNMFGSKLTKVTAHHVLVTKVLDDPTLNRVAQKAILVKPGQVSVEGNAYTARNVVVAAGIWTNELLPEFAKIPGLYGKQGVSFTFPGQIEGFIKPWAPYKQIVAHKHTSERFWAGDGTALLPDKWTQERQQKTEERVCKAVGRTLQEATLRHGIRPFVEGVTNKQPCYYKHYDKQRIWVVAGGGKNGMIASAWAANQILSSL